MYFLYLLVALLGSACSPVKNIAYFEQTSKGSISADAFSHKLYEPRIKPKDLLSITVVSSEPEASRRFNLIAPQAETSPGISNIYAQPAIQNYMVDNDGNINFPVLGVLQVKGLTKPELESLIKTKLAPYFISEMPIITIRFLNYSVNVLGEVFRPGRFETNNERITIFDGLALAGDMTIYGRRDNVKVIRVSADGDETIYQLNLTDKSVFSSPAYFLEQNDVVYVEPNQSRANSSRYGTAESYRISALGILISVATLGATLFGILRK